MNVNPLRVENSGFFLSEKYALSARRQGEEIYFLISGMTSVLYELNYQNDIESESCQSGF
jgi:hypothetical protein